MRDQVVAVVYTFEQIEIASYRILITGANMAGAQDTVNVYRDMLAKESEMANWLETCLPTVTREILMLDETEQIARH